MRVLGFHGKKSTEKQNQPWGRMSAIYTKVSACKLKAKYFRNLEISSMPIIPRYFHPSPGTNLKRNGLVPAAKPSKEDRIVYEIDFACYGNRFELADQKVGSRVAQQRHRCRKACGVSKCDIIRWSTLHLYEFLIFLC